MSSSFEGLAIFQEGEEGEEDRASVDVANNLIVDNGFVETGCQPIQGCLVFLTDGLQALEPLLGKGDMEAHGSKVCQFLARPFLVLGKGSGQAVRVLHC